MQLLLVAWTAICVLTTLSVSSFHLNQARYQTWLVPALSILAAAFVVEAFRRAPWPVAAIVVAAWTGWLVVGQALPASALAVALHVAQVTWQQEKAGDLARMLLDSARATDDPVAQYVAAMRMSELPARPIPPPTQ